MSAWRREDCLSTRAGRLHIDECDLTELADRFGTPLYVLSETQIRRNLREYQTEFASRWTEGDVRILPAIKANPLRAVARVFATEGVGVDCFGGNELELALMNGIQGELISLNGPHKSDAAIRLAIEHGARITLDGADEVAKIRLAAQDAGRPAEVRIRVRPDFSEIAAPTQFHREAPIPTCMAAQRYRLGMPTEHAVAAGREVLRCEELVMKGIHMHFGRHGVSTDLWRQVMVAYATLIADLSDAWEGWTPGVIDVGGGFAGQRDSLGVGYAYDSGEPYEPPPSVAGYAEAITGGLRDTLAGRGVATAGVTLEVEPGRAIVGDAGVHLARVRGVKTEREGLLPLCWIETDTSESFLPDVTFGDRMPILAAARADADADQTADVVGSSCNFDLLCADAELPLLRAGEVLAFVDTGAYHEAASDAFNLQPRPATVLVCGSEAEVIRRRETLRDLLRRDSVPRRLGGKSATTGAEDLAPASAGDRGAAGGEDRAEARA